MTDSGGRDKPEKPDPFAPLPLADLPPVRGRSDAPPPARTRAPSIPPTAFVQTEPPPAPGPEPLAPAEIDQSWGPPSAPAWEAPAGEPWPAPASTAAEAWTEAPVAAEPWTEAPVAAEPNEPPLLPAAYSEAELRDAVGVTPRIETKPAKAGKKRSPPPPPIDEDYDGDGDGDQPGKKRSRKTMVVAALSVVIGSGIAALVVLGKVNSAKYVMSCEAEQVVIERGRSFPPWGTSGLDGAEWKPLKIPPETPCHPQETEERTELAQWYLKMLTAQATKLLGAREITKVDEAEAVLNQALLISRELRTDGDAKDARADIDRLLGDVVYWRASARLRSASDTMDEAAKQFDAASKKNPAHFTDAAEWATYTRKVIDQLHAGPGAVPTATFPPVPPIERPTAPPGVALPVEPDGSGTGRAEPTATPDAGVPSGGVLL